MTLTILTFNVRAPLQINHFENNNIDLDIQFLDMRPVNLYLSILHYII